MNISWVNLRKNQAFTKNGIGKQMNRLLRSEKKVYISEHISLLEYLSSNFNSDNMFKQFNNNNKKPIFT